VTSRRTSWWAYSWQQVRLVVGCLELLRLAAHRDHLLGLHARVGVDEHDAAGGNGYGPKRFSRKLRNGGDFLSDGSSLLVGAGPVPVGQRDAVRALGGDLLVFADGQGLQVASPSGRSLR
jgi:hypothetical protein